MIQGKAFREITSGRERDFYIARDTKDCPMNPEPTDSSSPTPSSSAAPNGAARQLATASRGWTAGLTFSVMLGLVLEAVTGLWILLAPFSIISQLQVLLHTGAGLLLTVPYAVYQWRHYQDWRDQTLSVVKLVGYVGMGLTLASMVSGLVVTYASLWGRRLPPLWDEVHLVSGIAVTVLVALHLAFAYGRRRAALRTVQDFGARFRRRWVVLAGATLGTYVALGVAAELFPRRPTDEPLPAGYTLPKYATKEEYRGSPFAPTYARTASGKLINPDALAHSASCGTAGCHEQILAEWEPNAHRFSAMNAPFQAVQKKFAHDRSPADTRYCAGCHDPISLFAGAKDVTNMSLSAPGMQEGASCAFCHSISQVDQRGNADYVVTPPRKYLGEDVKGLRKGISDFLIRAYPRQHLADYNRSVLRTPEFCGACHKQFIPEALNRFGVSPAQNQYDEWRKSHWFNESHADKSLSCRDCHMRLVRDSRDPGAGQTGDVRRTADDHSHRHHGFIATNSFMPDVLKLPHYQEHNQLTEDWIKGKTVLPEIADVWPAGPVSSIELLAPKSAAPGQSLELQAVVHNRKAGHNFITGPLDFIRAWVHVRVVDADGHTLAEWGGIDPITHDILDETGKLHTSGEGPRNKGTLVLESLPMDADNQPILRHDLWRKAGGAGTRVIFPGYSDKQTYTCPIPATAKGPITVTAELDFRRYRQEFLNLMVPDMERESGVYQPTVTADATTVTIPVTRPESGGTVAGALSP